MTISFSYVNKENERDRTSIVLLSWWVRQQKKMDQLNIFALGPVSESEVRAIQSAIQNSLLSLSSRDRRITTVCIIPWK